ncbi:hypothetical protein BDA99DRAFT_539027 [Phascolomyces articulosus]|uniref:Uncharacterized protein n=1 Tax=Phascolomyces articulosus TaxID=60185 RepID=A0AAD5PDX3_9FUNG|nr:hypothetical protein BDA99DRAFT_539027 [Phascolomyces articulosus]
MVNAQQYLLFTELQGWVSTLKIKIKDSIQKYSQDPNLYEDMEVINCLCQNTAIETQEDIKALALKEEHHAFEHFLRITKYQLAIEKYHVVAGISPGDSQILHVDIIKSLEKIIEDYLSSHPKAFCHSHQHRDSEEMHLLIDAPGTLTSFEERVAEEKRHQQMHEERASRMNEDLN